MTVWHVPVRPPEPRLLNAFSLGVLGEEHGIHEVHRLEPVLCQMLRTSTSLTTRISFTRSVACDIMMP